MRKILALAGLVLFAAAAVTASCAVSGTTVTVTASATNSDTFNFFIGTSAY